MRPPGSGLHPSALPLQRWGERSRAGEEPDQVEGAVESGARVWSDEAEVRIREAALSRTEEERQPAVCGVRPGEPVSAAQKAVAPDAGLAREPRLLSTGEPPKRAEDRRNRNPNACTGMAEILIASKTQACSEFP